jgi:hypothetical protein
MKLNQICQKGNRHKYLLSITLLLSVLSLFAQNKHKSRVVKYDVKYQNLDTVNIECNKLEIFFTTGFERKADIVLKLNNKIISKCIGCKTNESIGFVEDRNTLNGFYHFTLTYSKVKLGDLLEFKYNNEMIIYKIEKALFSNSALYLYRYDKQWILSFERFREGNVE